MLGKGASTLDLAVMEFQSWCGQMDLASAYVLCPLNCLVLDFVTWNRGLVTSGGPVVYQTGDVGEDLRVKARDVKCWNSNSMGMRGYVKERLELTPMGSFDVEQGGVNSGPGSHGIPDGMRTDGPGFSLCAAPLESFGPGFQDRRVGGMTERRSGVYWTRDDGGDYSRGRS